MQSQCIQILADLKAGNNITALEAMIKFRCMRLAARILDLKEAGHKIGDVWVKSNGKRFKSYYMRGRK